ncbi:UNVERIFIED_CONTAM: hypothetical protein RMT77_008486 [Armadillidium vulgare]
MKEIQLICILFVCTFSILGEFASGELVVKPSRKPRLNLSCDGNHGEVTMGLTISDKTSCAECKQGHQCLDYGKTRVVVTEEDNCQLVDWTTTELTELKDCIDLVGHWYGGGGQITQPWPLEKTPREEIAFVTADMLQNGKNYGHVIERYWISSNGTAVRVDDGVPLFFSMLDNDGDGRADQMCLSSRYESPFVAEASDSPLNLTYYLCYDEDVLKVYNSTFSKFFSYPDASVDERMLTHPVWSTWAEYFSDVNEEKVISLAEKIQQEGFENSQIEIDDRWETCYGDATFDLTRFPDPKGTIDQLHSMGYRVTVWVTPFINSDCESYDFADQNQYFVKDENGTTQRTSWWEGAVAGIVDFTNPDAVDWWTGRLTTLKEETGVDGFKFDAGETNWLPRIYTLGIDKKYWPNGYTPAYVGTVATFGNFSEVRTGTRSQHNAIFVRMLDKSSVWTEDNGLRTMIPSLLHSGIIGYPFVLPDMIGGNAYDGRPSTELFVRWAQSNTFMPAFQISLLPWEFDTETINATAITKGVAELHAEYAPTIIDLANRAVQGEGPMMRPTWWLCPTEEDCLLADQQFLLGDDILVTPVVYEAATTLDVVFPPGQWKQSDTGDVYEGVSKQTIENINIESNIYFTRV